MSRTLKALTTEIAPPMTLEIAIKKKLRRKATFEELENFERIEVLTYIKNKGLDIKVFSNRGYDILSKSFFAKEYGLSENYGLNIEKILFKTFDEFYEYLKGDIYNQSCFYGYDFSKDEIDRYSINMNSINLDSFINETIDDNTFESLQEAEKEVNAERIKNGKRLQNWALKLSGIDSYEELLKKLESFEKNYPFFYNKQVFFSLIIQKFKEIAKDYCIKYTSTHDKYDGLLIDDILFYYGVEAAQTVIDNYDCGTLSASTKKKRIRGMKKTLAAFLEEGRISQVSGGFDCESQLYYVTYCYYAKDGIYPFLSVKKYFVSFDEFVKELDGDLSNCDLSKTILESSEVLKYKTNKKTVLPSKKTYSSYMIIKSATDKGFRVVQKWLDDNIIVVQEKKFESEFFCDFVHYLKGDLSNADFLMNDSIANIRGKEGLNLESIKVRSEVAKKLGLKLNKIPQGKYDPIEFEETNKCELETIGEYKLDRAQNDDYTHTIAYITDIHLLHRFRAWHCETIEDTHYVTRRIAYEIASDQSDIKLIGGDIASDYEVYQLFISAFNAKAGYKKLFVTLGNHELWSFTGIALNEIVEKYRILLSSNGIMLVHNNLYYFEDYEIKEITSGELESIDVKTLRTKMRSAKLIIFGGVGFSGQNQEFNANQGIYRKTLTREQEISESLKFESLYEKVSDALYDKNVIVFTHMPIKDWSAHNETTKGFVYVNGHNHRNYFFDDGNKRIYADNQIGYKQKEVHMKHLLINMDYDWFSDFEDGIYEIKREDYINFYRGIGEVITFNRQFERLYMLKREKTYMFLMQNSSGNLQILNGGAIKSAGGHPIEYFYDNLVTYARSVKMFLSQYDAFQKKVAQEIKSIGGEGYIHGSIVDIDFYNHLYLNPLDGTVTPYFAYSMVCKYVYKNLPSLLKSTCPQLYLNYEKKYITGKNQGILMLPNGKLTISKKTTFVESTEIYRISRIIKGLQYTTKYNIVRLWNDTIVGNSSVENGRLIVSGIINPEEMEKIKKEQKLIEQQERETTKQYNRKENGLKIFVS